MHILVVDDDRDILAALNRFLSREGYQVSVFSSAVEAIKVLEDPTSQPIDLIISDLKMPDMGGLDFVARVRSKAPMLPIIMITAFGSVEGAIEAIKGGVFDYVLKPLTLRELKNSIERAAALTRSVPGKTLNESPLQDFIIGTSGKMREVFELIGRVANSSCNVLIQGESGTGKEMVARAIHERGPRATKPFVAINCAAIPEGLLETELFGHAQGAFTGATSKRMGLFAEADGGTLFLDEIGDMPIFLQAKLLRVVQEKMLKPIGENTYRPIDIRIISATHQDLLHTCRTGKFREDLYYRLSVIPISIPPLRDRREDIALLADFFLKKHAFSKQDLQEARLSFTPAAINKMVRDSWPGNVRELENVIERAVILSHSSYIEEEDIVVRRASLPAPFGLEPHQGAVTLAEIERRYILRVLDQNNGLRDDTARALGIDRKTLYRKLREYGVSK